MCRIKALLVAVVIILAAFSMSFVSADTAQIRKDVTIDDIGAEITNEFIMNQTKALDNCSKIRAKIKKRKKLKRQNSNIKESDLDNYGGAYINDDGNLTVLVCDEDKFILSKSGNRAVKLSSNIQSDVDNSEIKDFESIVEDNVEYKSAKFTLDYLNEIYNYTSENIAELGLVSTAVSEINNTVILGVKDMDNNEIINKLITDIENFDRDSVEFKVYSGVSQASTSYPGRDIYSNSESGTSGFNVLDSDTGKYGVVTAGHLGKVGENFYNKYMTLIGKATKRQYSKKIDAVFIPYNSGFNPTYNINGSSNDVIVGYIKVAKITAGTVVHSYGTNNINQVSRISEVNVTVSFDTGVTLNGLVHISGTVVGGDSGGPVVCADSIYGGTLSTYNLLGIITGRYTDTNEGLVTKAGYILVTFDLALYCALISS